ncbi:MAG: hypothetical protein WCL06_08175 [Bacteroidota bacterium]
MTAYHKHDLLPEILFDLPLKKRRELEKIFSALSAASFSNDHQFAKTLKMVKDKIIIQPVTFHEPIILDQYSREKNFLPGVDQMLAGNRRVFFILAEIKFDGSPELFKYRPGSYPHYSGNFPNIYQPLENKITFEVEFFTLIHKEQVMEGINKQLFLTKTFINSNNQFINRWNQSISWYIENRCASLKAHFINEGLITI